MKVQQTGLDERMQAALHPVTLRFADEVLEIGYAEFEIPTLRSMIATGLLLATALFAAFGVVDVLLAGRAWPILWGIRGGVIAINLGLLSILRNEKVGRHYQAIFTVMAFLYGAAVLVMSHLVPAPVTSLYYLGLVLLFAGAHPVLGLRFINSVALCAVLSVMFIGLMIAQHDPSGMLVAHGLLVIGATVICTFGGFHTESERRQAFFIRRMIEQDKEASRRLALLDPLCGIPNRRLLLENIEGAIRRAKRFNKYCAVIFIDMDDFKKINDSSGHPFGDKLLLQASRMLSESVREIDTVARIGGDEFVVLLDEVDDYAVMDDIVERILARFRRPMDIDGRQIRVVASYGVACYPFDGETAEQLLSYADGAMYKDKQNHKMQESFARTDRKFKAFFSKTA